MKKILFRADAGVSIGTGDLMSLVRLSRYFEANGWESHFMVKDYQPAIDLVEKQKIARSRIFRHDVTIDQEVRLINDYLKEHGIDVIFFEITANKLTDYAGISNTVIKACVNFDGFIPDTMQLVVNWDIGAEDLFDIRKYPDTKFLLGTEYTILPQEFDFGRIFSRTHKDHPQKILVTMGGADEHNFTQQVVSTLIEAGRSFKLSIVVGSGYQFTSQLLSYLKKSSCSFELKSNIADMFEEFMGCDIAVSAGGLTSFELLATRTPCVLIATCKHQIKRCEFFDRIKCATYLGYRSFDKRLFLESIYKPRIELPKKVYRTDQIRICIDELLSRHKA